jgi:hypothetical protein
MNKKTCSLVSLGLAMTVGAALFLAGCTVDGTYWSLFTILPSLLALVCQYGISTTASPDFTPGWVSFDGWIFLLLISLGSVVGLPVVIWHCLGGKTVALVLYLVGAAITLGGYFVAMVMGGNED